MWVGGRLRRSNCVTRSNLIIHRLIGEPRYILLCNYNVAPVSREYNVSSSAERLAASGLGLNGGFEKLLPFFVYKIRMYIFVLKIMMLRVHMVKDI